MFAGIFTALLTVIAIAGGGGSGGGGGGGGGGGSGGGGFSGGSTGGSGGEFSLPSFLIFVAIIVGFILFSTFAGRAAARKIRENRRLIRVKLQEAAAKDAIWEEGSLETLVRNTFLRFQKDWSAFDTDSMKSYMTTRYYHHNLLMMGALKLAQRQNQVGDPVVTSAIVAEVHDNIEDHKDTFNAEVRVVVNDTLIDTGTSETIFKTRISATEYYRFVRSGKQWKFDGIDQLTANPALFNHDLKEFADTHGYFYSMDWGHLLLPRHGRLFSKGAFGRSDINNHVIGLHKDTIIQFYSYIDRPSQSGALSYLIAQVAVPKRYGNIVVRRRHMVSWPIRGLHRVKMEWGDFNSMYDVFASDLERVTGFELLHPVFMEKLQALPFEVNIEVTDNIIYLYSLEAGVRRESYESMRGILMDAFKELRL
jgi:hypothetical protein